MSERVSLWDDGRDQPIIWHMDAARHILRLVEYNLTNHGYQVTSYETCSGLRDDLLNPSHVKPDIIIIELELGGWALLQYIKSRPELAGKIWVIALTILGTDHDVLLGWQSGIDCYMVKPFSPIELLKFIQRHLSQIAQTGP